MPTLLSPPENACSGTRSRNASPTAKPPKFITALAAAGASLPLAHAVPAGKPPAQKKYLLAFFTKPLDGYELAFMVDTLAMAGLDGMDLSVRPGGRVEHAKVAINLPRVLEAGRQRNLSTGMMMTVITGPDSLFAEEVLRTASRPVDKSKKRSV